MNSRQYQAEQSDAVDPVPSRRLPRIRRWGERTHIRKPRLWLGGRAAVGRAIAQRPGD
jgi:hypothetical protein